MEEDEIQERLAYLKSLIIDEVISYGEIAELQSLAEYIDPNDTQLLEWAGIKEKTIYRKLVSLNPKKYKNITELQAYKDYSSYLKAYINSIENLDLDPQDVKNFNEWLNTEI